MIFKGTAKRPSAREISEAIEGIGGIMNGATGRESTVYWAKVASARLPTAVDVLADMVLNSLFRPDEVEKERRVIVEEIRMTLDSPADLVHDVIDEVLWGDQPLGWDIAGTPESLGRIGREELLNYVHSYYLATASVVSIAGNVEVEKVVDMIGAMLGSLPTGDPVPAPAAQPPLPGPKVKVVSRDTEQANWCLAVPALPYTDPRRYVLSLLNTVLGEGMSSRLFQKIREEQGLAYSVHSYVSQYRDAGSITVYAGVDVKQAVRSLTATLSELARMAREPVSQEELGKAKEYTKGRLVLGLEDTRGLAQWYGGQELLLEEIRTVDEVMASIDAVTAEDITALAQELFQTSNLNLAVVGPFTDDTPFKEVLAIPEAIPSA
jgi:predicted Zn-dependent peptidase